MRIKAKPIIRKNRKLSITRKRFCRFCVGKVEKIDYKDVKLLEAFITEKGKIVSRRVSSNCSRHQRRLVDAIKKARFISLLPYVRL